LRESSQQFDSESSSGARFLSAFSTLEHIVMRVSSTRPESGFEGALVNASNRSRVIGSNFDFLKDMGRLRNALVHNQQFPQIVADPREEVVVKLLLIINQLTNPAKVIPRFQRDLRIFQMVEPLSEAIKFMSSNDYSQIVVYDTAYKLLTSNGIVKWLGGATTVGLADIEGAIVADAVAKESDESLSFLGRDEALDKALQAFQELRLQAILITHTGSPRQKPLGLITAWDLLDLP